MIELPKNCIAAAMDKEIGKRLILMTRLFNKYSICYDQIGGNWIFFLFAVIYRLTVSTDSSLSMTEVRCLSDHQDQIRALINVNGQSVRKL